jgi:hypothetical protein
MNTPVKSSSESSNPSRGVWVGLVAALAASIGDFGELYVGNAMRPELHLTQPNAAVLWLAGLLGVLGLPLYGVGYQAVARSFAGRAPNLALVTSIAGIATGVLGAVVHGYTAWLINVQAHAGTAGGDPAQAILAAPPLLLWLWTLVALGLAIASAAFVAGHGRRFGFGHPLTLLNPFVLTVLLVIAGRFGIWGQAFLQPAAPNLAHVLFFALCLRETRRGRVR